MGDVAAGDTGSRVQHRSRIVRASSSAGDGWSSSSVVSARKCPERPESVQSKTRSRLI